MEKIKIKLFGEFSISYGDKTLSDSTVKSYKAWDFIRFIVTNMNREVSQSELIETFWGDNLNPANALKTLVHRARKELSTILPPQAQLIVSFGSSYKFNKELDYEIDALEFIELFKKAKNSSLSAEGRINCYKEMLDLYKGYLLCNSSRDWAIPPRVYFNNILFECADNYLALLADLGRWTDIINVCKIITSMIEVDEKIYIHLITAHYMMKNYNLARIEYENYRNLLKSRLDTVPSPELIDLYEKIIHQSADTISNLEKVLAVLNDKQISSGGSYCEFEIFRHYFTLYKNGLIPYTDSFSLTLITLTNKSGNVITDNVILSKAMDKLYNYIEICSESTNIFTRYSSSQYLLLTPGTQNTIKSKLELKALPYNNKYDAKLNFETRIYSVSTK